MTSTLRIRLLALTLLAMAACGGESTEQHIANAQQFLANEDYKSATIELKNALQQDKKSAQARWLLGKVHVELGDAPSAEKELQRARNLGWNKDDIRPALARALLAQGKFAQVTELSHEDLSPLPAARLLSSQALAALAQDELAEAQKLVAKALATEPGLLDAKMAEVRVLAGQGDTTGALIVLTEILSQAPEHGPAWSLQGDILLRQQQLEEALAAFDKSIELSPESFFDHIKRAMIELQLGKYEAAQSDADYLLNVAPRNPAGNYIQGILHFRNQEYTEAITALSLAEPASQQFPMLLFYLGSAHLVEGHQDQAAVFAADFFDVAPGNIAGRKVLATIRLQQGEFARVRELIQPVLDNNPEDVEALNLMANALLRDGETGAALSLLAKVAELQPDSATAQVRLGAGLIMSGQGDAAAEHMETALELDPEFQQADILLVMTHVQNGDFDEAVKAAMAYRRRNPVSVTPHNLLGRVYLASGSQADARKSFEKALTIEPGDPSANHNLAQMAVSAGDLAAARQRYKLTLEHHPNSLPALLQLAALDAREQDEDALVQHLQQAMDAHPTVLQPRLLLGRYYLGKNKPQQVAALFTTLDDIQKKSPQVLQLLAMAQLAGQQHSEAQFTLEQLVEAAPGTPSAHHMLAMAAAGTGDSERVKAELQRAVALDKNFLPSLLALARIAWAQQELAEFEAYMQQLLELAPEAPDVLRLRAAAARRDSDMDKMLEFSAEAFAGAPSTQTMLELAIYQKLAGKTDESRQLQQEWVGENPEDIPARLALAENLALNKQIAKAKTQYRAILELDPDNLVALNNLSWYLRLEDPEQAMAYIQHAVSIAPDRPEILDTLAVIEHLKGENEQAHRTIQKALAGAPDNPSMIFHQAMIEVALGDKASPRAALESILAKDAAEFPERDEARALLDGL